MAERIYFFHGNHPYLVNTMVQQIIGELNLDPFSIMTYDLEETAVDDVLEDLMTVSFFGAMKAVIVHHVMLLEKGDFAAMERFINYLRQPNPDAVLIMIHAGDMGTVSPLTQAIKMVAYIEKVKEIPFEDYPKIIMTMGSEDGFQIHPRAAELLFARTGADIERISIEMEKIKTYAIDTKVIDAETVIALVSRNLEENVFELTNAIVSGSRRETMRIFTDLVESNEDPLRILNTIAAKIKELMQVKMLLNRGYSQDQVAEHFAVKSGRAYYMVKNARVMSLSQLERHLDQLTDLDYRIKSGKIEKKLGMEFYLLGV